MREGRGWSEEVREGRGWSEEMKRGRSECETCDGCFICGH